MNAPLASTFLQTSGDALARNGGVYLPQAGGMVFLRDMRTLGRELVFLTPETLREVAPEVEKALTRGPSARELMFQIYTSAPSHRVQAPASTYIHGDLNFAPAHAKMAAALIEAGATQIPLDLDRTSTKLLQRDGIIVNVPPWSQLAPYAHEGTRVMLESDKETIVAPYHVYAKAAHLPIQSMIDTMAEARPLLEHEIRLDQQFIALAAALGLRPEKELAARRANKVREAAFHLQTMEATLPFLREMQEQNITALPNFKHVRIASDPEIDHPVTTTQRWIEIVREVLQHAPHRFVMQHRPA